VKAPPWEPSSALRATGEFASVLNSRFPRLVIALPWTMMLALRRFRLHTGIGAFLSARGGRR